MLLACLVAVVAVGCKPKPAAAAAPDVLVITVSRTNAAIVDEWIGTLDGFVNAQIHAQVTGYLMSRNYQEGNAVKKGDLLFQIDPRPFQAVLGPGEGEASRGPGAGRKVGHWM